MLVVFRGLPGTGKSHLVRELLKRRPGFLVLSRDTLRASVVPRPDFGEKEKLLIDDMILAMAGFLLDRGRDVVIDGMALSSAARVQAFIEAARSRGRPVRIIECVCAEPTAQERLALDRGSHPAADRGEKLYFEVKARFQAIPHPALTIDTDRDTAESLDAILAWLDAPEQEPIGGRST
jgi:predicted kinase